MGPIWVGPNWKRNLDPKKWHGLQVMTRHVRYMSGIYGLIWYILIYIYISIYIWYTVYIYINMLYVYIKISIHQNVKPGRTAVRWHPLAPAAHRSAKKKTGLSTDLHGSFWSPVSLVGMPHRSDIDRLSRCHMVSHIAVLAKHRKSTQ